MTNGLRSLHVALQDNERLLDLLRQAEADSARVAARAQTQKRPRLGLSDADARRPWSADATAGRDTAAAGQQATNADDFGSALLDAARTALNKERSMRHQVSRSMHPC